MSPDGERLLDIFIDNSNSNLFLIPVHPFIDATVVDDGSIFVTEETSHDLVHFDLNLKQLKRLQGTAAAGPQLEIISKIANDRKVVQPTTSGKLLWINGVSSLCVIELDSYKTTPINNFWTYNSQKCISIFVTSTPDFKRFAGIGLSPDNVQTLHVYDLAGGTGFSSASIKQLFKSRHWSLTQ